MIYNKTRNITKIDHDYYDSEGRINPEEYYSFVNYNLMKLVDEQELSLGDKLLIKNVAINTFHELLKFASTENSGKKYDLGTLLHLEHCEIAKRRLQMYGFKTRDLKVMDIKPQ